MPTDPNPDQAARHPGSDERSHRLEEALLFTDRRLDELHEHVLALGRAVDAMSRRLAALESAREGGDRDPGPEAQPAQP